MRISVILSTYNSPDWLEKCLWGYFCQQDRDFEIVIADDGSRPETSERISALCVQTRLPIRHVWQRDDGFRKTRILNKAILKSAGEYLLFSDGDCIPRQDFVAVHRAHAQPGHFLSGGYFKLPIGLSRSLTRDDISSGRAFDVTWLKKQGVSKWPHKWWKLITDPAWQNRLNGATRTRPSWNGHNASGWRSDIVAVNGFDERMRYGGEDRELGERMVNAGIRPVQLRYSAICLHLDHARGYVRKEERRVNDQIRRNTHAQRLTVTQHGLNLHADHVDHPELWDQSNNIL